MIEDLNQKIIVGAKKGGGQDPPTEQADSLQSSQEVTITDLISEGEIEGIEGGAAGVFVNKTALTNFAGYSIATRNGTQNQTYIPGSGAETAVNVGVALTVAGGPVTRTITDTNVDRVNLVVSVPALQKIESDGDIVGNQVTFQVHIQYNGGGYQLLQTHTIQGKSSGPYSRTLYLHSITGAFPKDIRLTRITADSTSVKNSNATTWDSYTQIIDDKLTYANSAICQLKLNAQNFSSVPERRYLVKGIKIQLPHNATVVTSGLTMGRVTYSGVFNGSLGAAQWCSDPAFILWDLLRNDRYGCGIAATHLDVFDFYQLSVYCNELVSNGAGGQEPRFSCNVSINTRDEAYKVISELTSVFRGMAYYGAGSLVLTQDKEADSQFIFSPANVIEGLFSYSGVSQKAKHTVVTVAYQRYDFRGETYFERVEDQAQIAKWGIIEKEVKAFGCYSQAQAQRLGRWILLSGKHLTQTVDFKISVDSGIVLAPGMVVSIADPLKGGTRRGGRISSATTTVVNIDTDWNLSVNMSNSPKLTVVLPSGLNEERTITNIATKAITVNPAFSQAPNAEAGYQISTSDILPEKYRVISVAEEDEKTLSVSALQYNSTIYNAVDTGTTVQTPPTTPINDPPNAITASTGSQYYYTSGANVLLGYNLSWTHDRLRTNEYSLVYKINNGNWINVKTTNPNVTLTNLTTGALTVKITPVSFTSKPGPVYTHTDTITPDTTPPGNVSGLYIVPISANSARLHWTQSVDQDVLVGGKVYIRHSSLTTGAATFNNSVDLINAIPGASIDAIVPYLPGEYMVKFEDFSGNKSVTEASLIVTKSQPLNTTLIQNRREDTDAPPYQGTKTNTEYYAPLNFTGTPITGLVITGDSDFDSVADVDALASFDFCNNVRSSAEYAFDNALDLGAVFDVMFDRHLSAQGFHYATGATVGNVNAELNIRTTPDPPSGSPTWSAWTPFTTGTFRGRGFEFKVVLTSQSGSSNIAVTELGYRASMVQRYESPFTPIASGTSQKAVTFAAPYFVGVAATIGGANAFIPTVNVSGQNLLSGEYIQTSSITGAGFAVDIKNASNNHVNRNFVYQSLGLG